MRGSGAAAVDGLRYSAMCVRAPRRAAPRPPRPLPAAANAPSTGPLTLLASVDAHPGGGGGGPVELAVNHLGVPMFVQKGCAE